MTIGYRFLLATVQEVTARMFTTTLRSQPVYSRSRLSEFVTAREPGRINETDPDNVGNRDATTNRWFHCLTDPPTYLGWCNISTHSFPMHMSNGMPELM